MIQADVLIIGSGISALQLAKRLRRDLNVIILTKSHLYHSNSYFAQGGVAAAVGNHDHPDKHYQDTLEAGRYHNHPEAVKCLIEEAPSLIHTLIKEGCVFDKGRNGELLLGMEGAHSANRIVHSGGDATGKNMIQFMASYPLNIIEDVFIFDLLIEDSGRRCIGVRGKYSDGKIESFFAEHIVLATGGCGQLYPYTSNVETVNGDGIALAYRAGASITDMEFIQFHPTLLYVNGKAAGLVSEAVRGEGGRLMTEEGEVLMDGIHPLGDLAPRHIVSQTIYHSMKNGADVFLDISAVEGFTNRFPTITALCKHHGVNLEKGLIPVVPGSHFLMGGIKTDLYGRTSINGLYAIGEAACTGVHGANRLASNSLLEGLFSGKKLAEWINSIPIRKRPIPTISITEKADKALILPSLAQIQQSMMDRVGIVRTKEGLEQQKLWLEEFGVHQWLDANLEALSIAEMTNVFMLITAWLVTDSALKRTESRGGHFRQDYPFENDSKWLRREIIHSRKRKKDEEHEQIEAKVTT